MGRPDYTSVIFHGPEVLTFVHGWCTVVHVTAEPLVGDRLAYTVAEAARLVGISRSGLYKLIRAGEIETVKIGAARRVTPEAIRAFLARNTS